MKAPKLPVLQIVLMLIFSIGGSILIVAPGKPIAAGLSLPTWIVCYFGYAFLIGACIIHYFSKDSKEEVK
jgi:hypothetical protein